MNTLIHCKKIKYKLLLVFFTILLFPNTAVSQRRLVKILIASPHIQESLYQPIADVMAGSIIQELKRAGGVEIIDREKSEKYIIEQGGQGWVATREQAIDIGEAFDADIVIYSTLQKNYSTILYKIAFLEVESNIIQQILKGSFPTSNSPSEIGRLMRKEVEKIQRYIPLSSELEDPGMIIRETTIDPDNLPESHEIEDFPPYSRYGLVEQVFTYYRVFPGELEYKRFESSTSVMRLNFQTEMDEELTRLLNLYNVYGEFATRHNLQAYFIQDCSARAINVLLANNIPVFLADELFLGYYSLLSDGFSVFKTLSNRIFDTTELSHRDRMIVFIIVRNPGKKGGISRDYLESAISRYRDEWGETPTLIDVKDGIFDIGSGVTE